MGYWFYKQWKANGGRFYAERVDTDHTVEARQWHRAAADFHWVTSDMDQPTLSGLYVRQPYGDIMIAPEQTPGEPYVGPRASPNRQPFKD